eukprot:5573303-Pyramimonas_sp.AAC.1
MVRHGDGDGHVTFNVESFLSSLIVHPNVGVRMVRARKDREEVPQEVIHLRSMLIRGLARDAPADAGRVVCACNAG